MNPEPITLKMVVDANIASLKGEGMKLGAFHGHGKCYYRYDDGCGCAIGVAIPNNHPFLNKLDTLGPSRATLNCMPIMSKCVKDHLNVENERQLLLIDRIQDAHDSICHANAEGSPVGPYYGVFIERLTKAFKEVYPGQPLPEVLTTT